jgi:hypothetical protein
VTLLSGIFSSQIAFFWLSQGFFTGRPEGYASFFKDLIILKVVALFLYQCQMPSRNPETKSKIFLAEKKRYSAQ